MDLGRDWNYVGTCLRRGGLAFRIAVLEVQGKSSEKSALPTALTVEWQLIEKIDRALHKAHIAGIDVYVKNGKVLLVATPEQQHDLSDARDLILALDGVQSVETSIKESSVSSSNTTRNFAQ